MEAKHIEINQVGKEKDVEKRNPEDANETDTDVELRVEKDEKESSSSAGSYETSTGYVQCSCINS